MYLKKRRLAPVAQLDRAFALEAKGCRFDSYPGALTILSCVSPVAFRTSGRKEIGCRIGVDHVGHPTGELEKLASLGLDYFKVDASLVHRIHQNKENQRRLKELCSLVQHVGIVVIACGVQAEAEQKALVRLGFDGFTGSGIEVKLKR